LKAACVQLYVPDTNVLLTRWMSEGGSAEVIDLMPFGAPRSSDTACRLLLRRVTVTQGTVGLAVKCMPRFDYARVVPSLEAFEGGIRFTSDALSLRLYASVPLTAEEGEANAHVTLSVGESAWFVLCEDHDHEFDDAIVLDLVRTTTAAWRKWLSQSVYKGRWREAVHRSALALKLLTSQAHGSIAAAATFALPEVAGGERNWDYRATWIRDASFTTYAFMRLGFVEEAEAFNHWVAGRVDDPGKKRPFELMYALDGSAMQEERVLTHLAGYAGSQPVRIGNDARAQLQLDIYGEMMDSVYLANKYGRAISHENWRRVCDTVEYVRANWQQADAGIWEVRSEARHFLHSRVMCWVALDRAIRLATKRSLSAPLVKWLETRDAIVDDIWTNFRHPDHGYFVQERGGSRLDGSLLLMPLVRFVSATDPVWLLTLDAIEDELRDDGLVYRYRGQDDGLAGEEGAFTTCTFWFVECLARAGRMDEAQLVLAKGLAYANPLGLFAEETDRRGQPIGNFPQALTHLSFISAAFFLDRRLAPSSRPHWQP
jgi:GH15 family glucan-1,4-alpha-glucosidase